VRRESQVPSVTKEGNQIRKENRKEFRLLEKKAKKYSPYENKREGQGKLVLFQHKRG